MAVSKQNLFFGGSNYHDVQNIEGFRGHIKDVLRDTEERKKDLERDLKDLLDRRRDIKSTSNPTLPTLEEKKVLSKGPTDWSYLVPVVGIAVIGSATLPYFALGLAVGVADLLITAVALGLLQALGIINLEKDNEEKQKQQKYTDFIKNNPLYCIILGPILEEGLFRGLIQPLLILAFIALFPTLAAASFFSTGLSVAAAAAILCTSLIFGLMHLSSSKDNDDYTHAFMTTLGGIVLGVLAVQFGMIAAIAAHIACNALAVTALIACDSPEEAAVKVKQPAAHLNPILNPDPAEQSEEYDAYFGPGSYLTGPETPAFLM